jgi:hypothetical protein
MPVVPSSSHLLDTTPPPKQRPFSILAELLKGPCSAVAMAPNPSAVAIQAAVDGNVRLLKSKRARRCSSRLHL